MYFRIKRIFDIIVSGISLVLLSPVLIISALAIVIGGSKTIFYRQKRIGYLLKEFSIIKFKTMLDDSPTLLSGTTTIKNDPRVTKPGKVLRITKINELPQFVNVLNGSMSIVGPRPLPMSELNNFSVDVFNKLYQVRPGITGISALIFRDEEAVINNSQPDDPLKFYNEVILPYKAELEVWYQSNISFLVDIKILALTAISVVYKKGLNPFLYFGNLPKMPSCIIK